MKAGTKDREIPKRERDIGRRLKEAREFLRLSQKEFADGIGVGRERIASYEDGRVPLRWEIALRLCRRFFISEFWLALGHTDFAGLRKNRAPVVKNKWGDEPFSHGVQRWTASLVLRPIVQTLKPGMLFSVAFDDHLVDEFKHAVAFLMEGGPGPVLAIFETDSVEYINYALACMAEFCTASLPLPAQRRFLLDSLRVMRVLYDELSREFGDAIPDSAVLTQFEKLIEGYFRRRFPK